MTDPTHISHSPRSAPRTRGLLALAACTLMAGTAAAQPQAPAGKSAAVDDAAARTHQLTVMAGSCANCHGTDGAYAGAIPAIAGRPASVLATQLLLFKNSPAGPANTVMGRIVKGYTDAELRQLADYYADKR